MKSVEITSLKTSIVSMDFVCAFDCPIKVTTVGKVKNHLEERLLDQA